MNYELRFSVKQHLHNMTKHHEPCHVVKNLQRGNKRRMLLPAWIFLSPVIKVFVIGVIYNKAFTKGSERREEV